MGQIHVGDKTLDVLGLVVALEGAHVRNQRL